MAKVFVVGTDGLISQMFLNNGWEVAADIFEEGVQLVQFTGGEDVTPAIYGEKNEHSYTSIKRDLYEAGIFAIAKRLDIPMAGICRGGQFLNVMSGGKMIQDVHGHGRSHLAYTSEGHRSIPVTSTHHQMMVMGPEATLIAYADIVHDIDPEVVFYSRHSTLCFQPHPEYNDGECQDYYFELLHDLFGLGA